MEQVNQDRLPVDKGSDADLLELPSQMRVGRYRLTLQAIEPLELPPHKGSTLRGGLGHVFRRTTCIQRHTRTCEKCLLYYQCPYIYVFETPVPEDAEVLRSHDKTVRPFVIEPPLDEKMTYLPGDTLTFGLTLVGRAIQYLPYFVIVFEELGHQGLGRKRGKYTLNQVKAINSRGDAQIIYSSGKELLRGVNTALTVDDFVAQALSLPSDRPLTVQFLSPARLKHNGRLVEAHPPFHVLVRTLLRRVSSLSYFHCGERWETDYRGWINRAEAVQIAETTIAWENWERYSGRQHQRIDMGGIVGSVTYSGDLAPFRPLLALGQWIHVGKGAVFGNGQYTLDDQ